MKFKKLLILSLFLLAILTIGAVSAGEDANATDEGVLLENQDETHLDVVEDEELSASGINIYIGDSDDPDEPDEDGTYTFEIGADDCISIDFPKTEGALTVNVNGVSNKLVYDEDEDYIYVTPTKWDSSMKLPLDYDDYDDDEGIYTYDISLDKLTPHKIYNITVKFKTTSKEFKIKLIDDGEVFVDVEDTYLYNKSTNRINITTNEALINSLDIKIDDNPCNFTKTSKTGGFVNISNLKLGEHTIIVTWGEAEPIEETFEVVAIEWADTVEYGSPNYVSFQLPDVDGTLKVLVDDKLIDEVTLKNGFAQVEIPSLSVGIHTLNIKYPNEDGVIEDFEDEFEVTPKVTLPSQMSAGENKYMIIEVGDSSGIAYIQADYENYATVNVKGKAQVSLKDLDDDEITITVYYVSEDYEFEEDYEIFVNPVPIRIVAKDIHVVYTKNAVFKVKIYDVNAKPAANDIVDSIKIGNQLYKYIKTDKKGVATIKIPNNLAPGKYDIVTIFDGVSAKHTLTVKHLLKLKKVKVKKSAKKLVLKATVKKVKGKKIVFKFKGKKYTAKTNKKGVAKVIIKKKVLKKLKKGKKVKYQATYLKDTVKRTVKVKK